MNAFNDLFLLVGRIALSAIFLWSGIGKIAGYAGTAAYMESKGVPGMLLPGVIALEIVAALAVIVGWQARLGALALAAFCLAAGLLFHYDPGDQGEMIQLMKNVAIAGGLLAIAAAGPGRIALRRN